MQGQIVKINSDIHTVICDDEKYDCKCRGKFRNLKITPLVGDKVIFDKEKRVIEEILPRKNFFLRPSVANIDRAFVITSLKDPDFSLNLLDKLLSSIELHNVEAIICITKADLVEKEELKRIKNILKYYEKIGYKVVYNTEIDTIKKLLKNKVSVFTGQTGAGKSTLLNKLNPSFNLKTGEISKALGRGKHTTRVVEIFDLAGGKVLDTPGFSYLEFKDYSNEDIRDSFVEFKNFPCPFKDCMHTKEKECQVKKEVFDNNILKSRYDDYLNFIEKR